MSLDPSAESCSGAHPVLAAMAALDAALAGVAELDPGFMGVAEKREALLGLSAVVDRVEELRMRVLAQSEDLAAAEGARDPAAWLAHHGRRDRAECRHRLRLARALAEHERTAEALRSGAVTLAQAQVITHAIGQLPGEVGGDVRAAAEDRLVAEAGTFGPAALRRLGRRVVEVVAPEAAEALEGRLLAREEARAARRTFLTTRRNGDGTTDLRARLPDPVADRLLTYLDAHTSPRHHESAPPEDRRPYPQRLGAAFGALLEAIDPARLPLHGGDATTVIVTIALEDLRHDLGAALVGDDPITAGQARRLACTAAILPAVLDGTSQVLDLGRTRRLFTPAQRKALAITQPTCRAEGCDIPAPWCEAHHAGDPWARGGHTDLADGRLLCTFHHHRAHDPTYDTHHLPDGHIRYHRRT